MKAILFLLLAIGFGYVSYNYMYEPMLDSLGISRVKIEKKVEIAVVAPAPAPRPEPKPEPIPMPAPEPKPEMKPEPPPPPPPPPMPEPEKPKDGFTPPTFDPIEVMTANWTKIPVNFFATPKAIKVLKELEIKMKVGAGMATTKVAAGGTVYAHGQDGANILISPVASSPGRAAVPIDDTDIKTVFTAAYEQLKITMTERSRAAWDQQQIAKNQPKQAAPLTTGGSNGKPAKEADGSYPLLLASMKSGQVTEIKPENIKKWGDVTSEKIDGTTYWTVVVKYETQTMFGKFETEALARIKDGKVDKWVYVGSGEVVP